MSLIARLTAAGLGAGILFAGAGSALAAPVDDTVPDSPATATGPAGNPAVGPAPTYVLEGVGVPFADPSLGVPKVLEAGVLPFGLLADAAGEGGSTASPQGAQNGPGSTEA